MTADSLPRPAPLRIPVAEGRAIAAGVVLLLAAYLAGPSIFLMACASTVLWAAARGRAERALALLLPAAFRLALLAGAFPFEPPVQVLELAVKNVDPRGLIMQQDLWWPRYLVSYPAIVAMDHWGMRFSDAFALYSAALLPLTAAVLLKTIRTWRRLDETPAFLIGLGIAALVGLIATQMNGRLIPAHLGMAIILLVQGRIFAARSLGLGDAALLGGGLVLGHMSSGTGLVAFTQFVAGSGVLTLAGIERRRVFALLWLLTVLLGPIVFRDIVKNMEFYGGGLGAIVNMLDHGPGVLLRQVPLLLAAAVALALLAATALWRARGRLVASPRALWPAMIALPVTVIGGLYGYSTLTMGIPAAMVLAAAGGVAMLERGRAARPA